MEFSPPKSPIFHPKLNCKNFNFGFYFLHVNFRVKHMYNPGIWVSFNSHSHACSRKLPRNTFISGLGNRLELDFSNDKVWVLSRRWNRKFRRSIFEIRIQNFCYIQVIVFDLSYLPLGAVGTKQVRYHEKIVKNIKRVLFHRRDPKYASYFMTLASSSWKFVRLF